MSALPRPRGPLSSALIEHLERPAQAGAFPAPAADPLGEDAQLSLYVCYELHYRNFEGVDERWEWEPTLLAHRRDLETQFEEAIRDLTGPVPKPDPDQVGSALMKMVGADEGPALSKYVELEASLEQFHELVIHRSAYQLKEADPHSWAIPRLSGPAKAALVEVQADEYGGGRPARVHATLFGKTMLELGLDATYGAYLDRIPAITLATVNLMSLFGLQRRLRGAIVGHLAAFETSSPVPNRRYANGLRRLGLGDEAADFFDEHVEADSVHENIATYDMAEGLARAEPELASQIIFGAAALLSLERLFAEHLLGAWQRGESSLLPAVAAGSQPTVKL